MSLRICPSCKGSEPTVELWLCLMVVSGSAEHLSSSLGSRNHAITDKQASCHSLLRLATQLEPGLPTAVDNR